MIRIRRKRIAPSVGARTCPLAIARGRGIRRTISMSNTKKITASRKNRREKGIRALPRGSKPHSNGEAFSRSRVVRWAKTKEVKKTISTKARAETAEIEETNIALEVIYTFFGLKAQR